MSTEASKALVELEMFRRFVTASGLPVAEGIERKGDAKRGGPDILCMLAGKLTGFELAEACAPEFAEAVAAALRSSTGVMGVWGDDVSHVTLRKKLTKRYDVRCPIHLLLYRNCLTALTDDVIIARFQPEFTNGLGQFLSVWFHGDKVHFVAGTRVRA